MNRKPCGIIEGLLRMTVAMHLIGLVMMTPTIALVLFVYWLRIWLNTP